jgi:hypothetical protein
VGATFPKARLSPFPTEGKSCISAAKHALINTSPPTPCPKIDPLPAPVDHPNFPFLFLFLIKREKRLRAGESCLLGTILRLAGDLMIASSRSISYCIKTYER